MTDKKRLTPIEIAQQWRDRRERAGASQKELNIINRTIERIDRQAADRHQQELLESRRRRATMGSHGGNGPDSFARRFGGDGHHAGRYPGR